MEVPLKKFCDTKDTKYLKEINYLSQLLLIDVSYSCLFQKYGDLELAKTILKYYGEIETILDVSIHKSKTIATGSYQKLKRTGVTTIPVFTKTELPQLQKEFQETLLSFPEYSRQGPSEPIYVLGGFGALGNPASFHNPLVRKIRLKCRDAAMELFRLMTKHSFHNLNKIEMLWDRLMFREKGQSPSQETWHRDVIPPNKIGEWDEVFGGWVNLDSHPQYFSCILGSHLGVKLSELTDGFATIPKKDVPIFNKYKTRIEVPPGHMIIFPQYILHEVLGSATKYNMMRLFLSWRLTNRDNWIHGDTPERVASQDIMKLPSGQLPAMYSKAHLNYYQNKPFAPIPNKPKVTLRSWSNETFIPKIIRNSNGIIPRFLSSLKDYNLSLYTPYTEKELNNYRPTKII